MLKTSRLFLFLALATCLFAAQAAFSQADLTETAVTVSGSLASGGTIKVTDTARNIGSVPAGSSMTRVYLNTIAAKGGTALGGRTVPTLAAGAINGPATLTLTLPVNVTGTYYIVACANDTNSVIDANASNNCSSSAAFTVVGADIAMTKLVVPSVAVSGTTIPVINATSNVGAGSAGSSITRFYLNTTATKGGSNIASRTVPTLAAGEVSELTTNLAIPASYAGNYYLVACANDSLSVPDTNTANNCTSAQVNITGAGLAISVDAVAGTDTDNCGTSTAPCKTITKALSIATAGQVVLAKPGTYTEQLNITKNVTLTSTIPYGAIIAAPAPLVPTVVQADPLLTYSAIISVSGGATNVILSNLSIVGGTSSACDAVPYGVFVANANATIEGNKIYAIRPKTYTGCQNGVAIRFGHRALAFIGHTGSINNNLIYDYQKGGIVVDGDGTNVTVANNTVTGQNTPGVNGQNGIQISRGAMATVTGNTVTANVYFVTSLADPNYLPSRFGPAKSSAAGILVYDDLAGVTVSNNKVTGNDQGIAVNLSSNVFTSGNTVLNNRAAGIYFDNFASLGNKSWGNVARFNGKTAAGVIVGFLDSTFAQGYGYDLVDENVNPNLVDWGYSGTPGSTPTTYDTACGSGTCLLFN